MQGQVFPKSDWGSAPDHGILRDRANPRDVGKDVDVEEGERERSARVTPLRESGWGPPTDETAIPSQKVHAADSCNAPLTVGCEFTKSVLSLTRTQAFAYKCDCRPYSCNTMKGRFTNHLATEPPPEKKQTPTRKSEPDTTRARGMLRPRATRIATPRQDTQVTTPP